MRSIQTTTYFLKMERKLINSIKTKNLFAVPLMAILIMVSSCQEDDISKGPDFEFTEGTQETFDPLTLETLSTIQTPFADLFGISTAGRIDEFDISIDTIKTLIENNLQGATVVDFEVDEERGLTVWKIAIKFETGSYLEIVIVPELAKVLEVEGQRGPFDYDLDFGDGFVTLQQAIDAALEAVGSGEVIRWELELEEENEWEFEILIVNELGKWEVEIKAGDGVLIEIKGKDRDEEDEVERDVPGEEASQDIIDAALAIVEGEVIHSEREEDDEGDVWEVVVKTSSGAIVKIELLSDGTILEIDGEDKPFDYEVTPGEDLLTFREALEIAQALTDGKLSEWGLEREEGVLIYEFEFRTELGVLEITLDASSGDVLSKELDGEEKDDGEKDGEGDHKDAEFPQSLEEVVSGIVEGQIIRTELETPDSIWYVKVMIVEGVYVKLEMTNEGELLNIEGSYAPFDYEVTPGGDLITFSRAKEIAFTDRDGELIEWALDHTEDGNWIYELYIAQGETKITVKVNAATGELTD